MARCGGTVPTLQAFPSGLQGGDVLCGCLCLSPFPLQLLIFFVAATVLYITAFIACAAAVDLTSLRGSRPYNQRSAASFFACLVMIAYGVSAFFSFQAWRGVGSNAATSQMAGGYS